MKSAPRSSGRYEQKVGDATLPIPSPTAGYAGRLPRDVAAEIGAGSQVEIGCPFHASVSGRSATLRVSDGGHVSVSCHVEQVTYSLGWLGSAVDVPDDDVDAFVDAILESISAMPTTDVAAPNAFPPPEPLPLHKVTERVGALAPVVAPSLSGGSRDCERQVPEGTEVEIGQEVEDAARKRATDLGDAPAYCVYGPYQHAADDRGRASTSRLACLSYTCPTCGPHVLLVLQAAAEVVVERIVNWKLPAAKGAWEGCVATDLPSAAARALQRWAATEDEDAGGVAPDVSREWRLHNVTGRVGAVPRGPRPGGPCLEAWSWSLVAPVVAPARRAWSWSPVAPAGERARRLLDDGVRAIG